MHDLPLNGRDLQQLILIAPGVNQINATGNPGTYTHGNASTYSVAGLRPVGMFVLQDGANVSNFYFEGAGNLTANTSLGVESIAEFQQLTGNYSAEFGGQGSIVNQATRSGTNQFHGSGYGFFRSSAVDAKNYVFPDQASVQPSFHKLQAGASVGGPIVKDRTFFFLNFEAVRASIGSSVLGTTFDANARNGYLPCAYAYGAVCNPTTGFGYVGVSPNVAPLLQFFPQATGAEVLDSTGAPTGSAYFTGSASTTQDENYGTTRIDHKFSGKDSLFGSYTIDNGVTFAPSLPITGYGSDEFGRNQYFTIEESHIFSAGLLNVSDFHFVRQKQQILPQLLGSAQPLLNLLGAQYAAADLIVGSLSSNGAGTIDVLGDNRFGYTDHVFYTVGKHTLKIGLDVNRYQGNINEPLLAGGEFIFPTTVSFLQASPYEIYGAIPGSGSASRGFREIQIISYVQDDYKVNSKLVLNLGLRYGYVTNPTDASNQLYALIDPTTATSFTHVDHAFASNPSKRNFDPRIGLAYSPFGGRTTSIRGGFGMYHLLIAPRDLIGYAFGYPYLLGLPIPGNVGVPVPFPAINPVSATTPLITLTPLYSNKSTPYSMVYNLEVQQQLNRAGIFSLGYLGSSGVHQPQSYDLNDNIPTGTYTDGRLYRPITDPVNPAAGTLDYEIFNGGSHFDSLQTSLRETFSHLQLLSSYTWSRCADFMSEPYTGDGLGQSATAIFDPLDLAESRGRCDYNVAQNFNASVIYQVPYKGRWYLQGFQPSLITIAHSGLPYTPLAVTGSSNVTAATNTPPDRVAGVSSGPSIQRKPTGIYGFNPAGFTPQPYGVVGNAGRDNLIAPKYVDADFGLLKNTPVSAISDTFVVQLRWEVFNALNHPNFAPPNAAVFTGTPAAQVASPTAGLITNTTGTMRQMQFGIKVVF